jgi:hypothetical protein
MAVDYPVAKNYPVETNQLEEELDATQRNKGIDQKIRAGIIGLQPGTLRESMRESHVVGLQANSLQTSAHYPRLQGEMAGVKNISVLLHSTRRQYSSDHWQYQQPLEPVYHVRKKNDYAFQCAYHSFIQKKNPFTKRKGS